MIKAPIPDNDSERLKELYFYNILDSRPDPHLDELTKIVANICDVPICLISLVDKDRQWFKACYGLAVKQTPRDVSFCGHVVHQNQFLEVEDATKDPRFFDNPLVCAAPNVIFYAGYPLITSQGFSLGTLCVIDHKPKKLNQFQKETLAFFAKSVLNSFEANLREKKILDVSDKLTNIVENIPVMLSYFDEQGQFEWVNKQWIENLGWNLESMKGKDMLAEFYPDPNIKKEVWSFMANPNGRWKDCYTKTFDGKFIHTSWTNVKTKNGSIGIGINIEDIVLKNEKLNEFKKLFELSSDLLCIAKDGYFITLNSSWEKTLGFSSQELLAKPFLDFVHPEDIASTLNEVNKLNEGHKTINFTNRYLTKDGSYIYLNWHGTPDPETGFIYAVARNISNEKEYQFLLERKNFELSTYEKALNLYAIIARTNPEGIIKYVNEKFCEISGYSQSELIGKTHRVVNSKYHPKEFFKDMWEQINSQKFWRGQIKNKRKDGTSYWVDTTIAPIIVENKIVEFISFRYEITKEKNQEIINKEISKLRASFIELSKDRAKFFNFMLAQILQLTESQYGFVGEVLNDDHGRYLKTFAITDISWNEETAKFYRDNAPKGLEFKNLKTLFGEVLKTGEMIIANQPSQHPKAAGIPKGHPPLNHFLGLPIYNSGNFIGMVGVANREGGYVKDEVDFLKPYLDVIGEMIYLININQELEQQVKISHHNSKLASIGQLASGVGHEINNPLAIIKGLITIIEMDLRKNNALNSVVEEKISKINLSINRITNIVKGLRAFSRADEAQNSHFALYDLVEETYLMIKDIYHKDGLVFELKGQRDGIFINANRGRLQQVLVNLISNAKDATESVKDRKIILEYKMSQTHFYISVEDNGSGIDPQIIDKIFDPFFTTKEVNKGTGIGLSLVNNIVKEHHGQIDIESQLGKGTKFIIKLPIKQLLAADGSKLNPEVTSTQTSSSKFNISVLVVDDEEDLRDILNTILSLYCHQVIMAKDGMEALEILSKQKIDLVFSDIKMPKLNGFEFLEKVRANKDLHQPRFIFLTGGVDDHKDKLKPILAKIDGVLSKPFGEEDVYNKIKSLFS